jgi:hypothetical protein
MRSTAAAWISIVASIAGLSCRSALSTRLRTVTVRVSGLTVSAT